MSSEPSLIYQKINHSSLAPVDPLLSEFFFIFLISPKNVLPGLALHEGYVIRQYNRSLGLSCFVILQNSQHTKKTCKVNTFMHKRRKRTAIVMSAPKINDMHLNVILKINVIMNPIPLNYLQLIPIIKNLVVEHHLFHSIRTTVPFLL